MTIPEALQVALQHHEAGRLGDAEAMYRQILAVQPQHTDALHLLGVIAHQVGRHEAAVELICQAIALAPGVADYHSNLGEAQRMLGQWDAAIAAQRRALHLQPGSVMVLNNLGSALMKKDEREEAIAAFREAVRLKPDYVVAQNNLGNALSGKGQFDEAISAYEKAVQLQPDYAEAYNSLGIALGAKGRHDEAIAAYRRAITIKPDYIAAYSNLGAALTDQGRGDQAIATYQRAIQIDPDYAETHNNLGVALTQQGQAVEAITAYRRALYLKRDYNEAHSNLLLNLHYLPDLDPQSLFEEHCHWEQTHGRPLAQYNQPHANGRDPERRLRIGYVSPDFREHSVAYFFEDLLACNDVRNVEVFCYANLTRPDEVTARLRRLVPHWREIPSMQDAQIAELIRGDKIDILVDLAGHTARNRLAVFACKPAPVQVAWLGYPDTTGLKAMDYRLTDALADPPGTTEHLHTEQLIRLPECAWCFRPSDQAPPVSAPPVLREGHITFGCFNSLPKINAPLLTLWSEILLAVPGSRLLLKNGSLLDTSTRQRIHTVLESSGITPERIELADYTPAMADHLGCYGRVDIALDTFPYHGTTTTCEALWMGVPAVTLAGKTHASRVGVSLLTNAGLQDLIAGDAAEYVSIATALARNAPRLVRLHASLREQLAVSPLLNGVRFARDFEEACRRMWRAWCAKPCSPPAS